MNCRGLIFAPNVGGLVPCGQCLHCRTNRRRKKTARLALEGKAHDDVLFVTLTYSEKYLPTDLYNPKTGQVFASHPLGCLDRRAPVLFVKRLRRRSKRKLRVYYCGEYGENKGRPHYHFIIWGLPYSERKHIYASWTDPHTGDLMCDPKFLDVQVPKKEHDVFQYCNAYILKGNKNAKSRSDGRPPEFAFGSLGLGKNAVSWIVQSLRGPSGQDFILRESDIPRTFKLNGKTYPIDRYLRAKIAEELGIQDMVTSTGLRNYEEEMSDLYSRSSPSQVPTAQKKDLIKARSRVDHERIRTRMKNARMSAQHAEESSQHLKTIEKRNELFNSKKGEKL